MRYTIKSEYVSLRVRQSNFSMNKPKYQTQTTHIVVQAIKNFIGKIRQNPDVYPIRYYKKNRRIRRDFDGPAVK